jgi:hypothetical protein
MSCGEQLTRYISVPIMAAMNNVVETYWEIRNKIILMVMDTPLGTTLGQIINQLSANGTDKHSIIEVFNDLVEECIIYEQNGYWYI